MHHDDIRDFEEVIQPAKKSYIDLEVQAVMPASIRYEMMIIL
jgi:hypothetical protein